MKVFISGSIKIKEIPVCAIQKIDNIITRNLQVIIGDAKGIDSLVQKYLLMKSYHNVMVYYAGDKLRNNFGDWPTKQMQSNNNEKGRDLFTLKDIQMAEDADFGLMIWDGESKGTLSNIKEMKERNKRFFVVMKNVLVLDKDLDTIINMHLDNLEKKEVQAELF